MDIKDIQEVRKELVDEWNKILERNSNISELNNKQIIEMLHLHQVFIGKCLCAIELLLEKK